MPLCSADRSPPGEDHSVTPTPTTDEWGIDAGWLDALD